MSPDLESDLSQLGNVTVMTTGNGVEANNIVVRAAFSSPDSTSLTLNAHKAITINAAVSIGSGTAELELQTDGQLAALSFGRKGHITFGSLSDIFGINGGVFTLVGSVQGLASAVAANPSGAFALANSYDASGDGVYASSPIDVQFSGTFFGLGNVISKLTVVDNIPHDYVGLFAYVSITGALSAVRLSRVVMEGTDTVTVGGVGGIAGVSKGTISDSETSGRFVGGVTGGLVGENAGTIEYSHATARIRTLANGVSGGLVGKNIGTIGNSWSVGSISRTDATSAGGLVGDNEGHLTQDFSTDTLVCGHYCGGLCSTNEGTIIDSYSTGPVSGHNRAFDVGGFVAINTPNAVVETSYSTGFVSGKHKRSAGGFFGIDQGSADSSYWDTDTSGTDMGSGNGNESGITGLTTAQLQSGLPTGFDPKIWAESPNINNGFPYLIHNPPPK